MILFALIGFDPTVLGEYGIGVVAIIVIFLLVRGFFDLWGKSIETQKQGNDALNRNTDAYTKLSGVFEKSHEREMEFQREALKFHQDAMALLKDTNAKVDYLHEQKIKGN